MGSWLRIVCTVDDVHDFDDSTPSPQRLGIRIENLGAHSDVDVVARRVCRALVSVIPWGQVKARTAQIRKLVLQIHKRRREQEEFVGLLREDDEQPPEPAELDASVLGGGDDMDLDRLGAGIVRMSSPDAALELRFGTLISDSVCL